MNLSRSTNGQARNLFAVIIFLFIFGFLNILGYLILDSYIDVWRTTGTYSGAIEETGDAFLLNLRWMDHIFVVVLVLLVIGTGVTSFKISSSPIFFFVTFVMSAFYGLVSYWFNYLFAQMVSQTVFNTTIAYFSKTILICTNLHWVMLINIIVASLTLYAKRRGDKI